MWLNVSYLQLESNSEWLKLDPSLAVGLTVAVCPLFAIPYTGCGLNPARSLGPAVASLTFDDDHFVYWAGPIVGAVLAASVYHIMYFRWVQILDTFVYSSSFL